MTSCYYNGEGIEKHLKLAAEWNRKVLSNEDADDEIKNLAREALEIKVQELEIIEE